MEFLPPLQELLPFLAGLVAAGAVAGFLAGLFGIGGGAVLVPVFYQMLTVLGVDASVRMHVCVATSLAIIVPTSLRSFQGHYKRGSVDMGLIRAFLIPVPLGAICASILAAFISGESLKFIFAVVAVLVAAKLLFGRDSWRLGSEIPGNPLRGVIGWLIGFFSTFMGIGGGIFNNTFMTLYGRQMLQSVATSAGVGVLISVPGVLGYVWGGWGVADLPPFSLGYVNLLMMAVVIPMTLLVTPFGVAAAHRLPKRYLEIGFGLFMIYVAARFVWSLLG
jgi:uncharacterized membrane protein YfcA